MRGGFASLHPAASFTYYAGLVILAMLLLHPIFLLTLVVAILSLIMLHGQRQRTKLWKMLPFYLAIGGLIAILNPLFSHRGWNILFYFMDQPITLEAILYGVTMMLSILSILLLFLSYQYIITPDKFMYLFSTIAPKTSLLTLMSIRFVPLLIRRLKQITMIQRTRGIDVRHGSYSKRMKDGLLLLRVLLMWSLEEALQTADSMKARGYGTAKRSAYTVYRMSRRDWGVLLFLLLTALLCCIGWAIGGFGSLQIYPTLEPMGLSLGDTVSYVCFCLFVGTPIILEGRERMAWKS